MTLEDHLGDIVRKARQAANVSLEAAAQAAALLPAELNALESSGQSSRRPDYEALSAVIGLHGRKLRGGYVLQRVGQGDDVRRLLIKMKGEGADARRRPVSTEPESVLSGRTVDAIEAAASSEPPES